MQKLVFVRREITSVDKQGNIVANGHVGGIRLTYKLVQPGKYFLGRRWRDKTLGEFVFFKPMSMHLENESLVDPDARNYSSKSATSLINTWLILNSTYNDINVDKRHIRIKAVVLHNIDGNELSGCLNKNMHEIVYNQSSIKSLIS